MKDEELLKLDNATYRHIRDLEIKINKLETIVASIKELKTHDLKNTSTGIDKMTFEAVETAKLLKEKSCGFYIDAYDVKLILDGYKLF